MTFKSLSLLPPSEDKIKINLLILSMAELYYKPA